MKNLNKNLIQIALYFLVLVFSISILSCDDNDDDDVDPMGKIVFKFAHFIDGSEFSKDSMMYTNAAGNLYEVNVIQYFITNITLHKSNGSQVVIKDRTSYYVDTDIPTTLAWNPVDKIPTGDYSSISFTFGIDSANNTRSKFVNAPEKDMSWPPWGGENCGYHYMKLNGSWNDTAAVRRNFGFHLGVGMKYDQDSNMINCQNYFSTSLSNSSFKIIDGGTVEVQIVMNIENWFENPNIYNHNEWDVAIMMNQDAQQVIKENGQDVFSIGYIN